MLEDFSALRLSACVVSCLHVPGLKLHVGTYMYMYRNKSVVKTNGVVILFSVEKWIVNHWKDGPRDTGIHVCKQGTRGHLELLLHSPIFNPLSDGKFMAKIFLMKNTVMVKN